MIVAGCEEGCAVHEEGLFYHPWVEHPLQLSEAFAGEQIRQFVVYSCVVCRMECYPRSIALLEDLPCKHVQRSGSGAPSLFG